MEELAFPELLAELRATRDLSLSDIARAVKVHPSRVSEWQRGLGRPSPQSLDRLAATYGLDVDQLLRVCGYRSSQPLQAADREELEILALFREVPADQRGAAKTFIRFLAVQPAQRRSSGRPDELSKRLNQRAAELSRDARQTGQNDTDGTLRHPLAAPLQALLRLFRPLASPDTSPSVAGLSL